MISVSGRPKDEGNGSPIRAIGAVGMVRPLRRLCGRILLLDIKIDTPGTRQCVCHMDEFGRHSRRVECLRECLREIVD